MLSPYPPIPNKGLLLPSSVYSRSWPIRSFCVSSALTLSSDHPNPEVLCLGRVMLSHPILARTTSSACLIDSSHLPSRLYGRPSAFKDSSCLSIRLSPLYPRISHRLPPSIRRKVYQVLLPIPSPIPLAIAKSQSPWHLHLFPLQSAPCGGVLRRCNVRITLRPPVLLSSCADLNLPLIEKSPTSFLHPSLLKNRHLLLSRTSLPR